MKQPTIFVTTSLALTLSACVSTNADVPRGHPANPSSSTTPIAFTSLLTAVAASTEALPASAAATDVWTCSMHPEVAKSGPGQCPVCGMNLIKRPPGKDAK